MAHVVVLGAGIGGMPAAYELRARLDRAHRVTVINAVDHFQFVPSNPWLAVGWRDREAITFALRPSLERQGIDFIAQPVTRIDAAASALELQDGRRIDYDHLKWSEDVAAGAISFWVYLTIGLLGAFAISFYFSANTIIYYLMRREVDATELDDVYVEESEDEFGEPLPVAAGTGPVVAATAGAGPTTSSTGAGQVQEGPAGGARAYGGPEGETRPADPNAGTPPGGAPTE